MLLRNVIPAFRPNIFSEPVAPLDFDIQILLLEVLHEGGSCGMTVSLQPRCAWLQLAVPAKNLEELLHGRQLLPNPLGPFFEIEPACSLLVALGAQGPRSSLRVRHRVA